MERRLELVEEYILHGERRFRLRLQGTRLVINVSATSLEEAVKKASRILERIRASKLLEDSIKEKNA